MILFEYSLTNVYLLGLRTAERMLYVEVWTSYPEA
jgi:hypothetical protein